MKVTNILIVGTLSASLLLTGCSETSDKKPTETKQPVSESKKGSTKTEKDAQSISNIKDKELVEYVSKRHKETLDFLKVVKFPNTSEYTKDALRTATAQATPNDKITVHYQFKNAKSDALDFSMQVDSKDDLSTIYTNSNDYSKKTVDGVDYYVSDSETLRVFFVNKEGHSYSLYSDVLDSNKLIEVAKTFKTNDSLSDVLSIKAENIYTVDYIHESNLADTNVFSTYSVFDGTSFTIQNTSTSVSQSKDDKFYQFALNGLKESPDNYKEVEIGNGLKGITRSDAPVLYVKKGDVYFVISDNFANTSMETLIDIAKEF